MALIQTPCSWWNGILTKPCKKTFVLGGNDPMINCLSSSKFANLLFVNVQIGTVNAIALFDTGAGMTVISKSLLHRLCASPEKETLHAGNNNGMVREFQTAALVSKPDDYFTGCGYLRQAIRPIGGDRGAAGIRFPGRPRLAAGAGVQASAMR